MDEGGIPSSDYRPLFKVWRDAGLTLRVRYDFMAEHPGREFQDYQELLQILPSHLGDDWLKFVGPGEIVVFGMYDGSLVAKDVKPSAEAKNGYNDVMVGTSSAALVASIDGILRHLAAPTD